MKMRKTLLPVAILAGVISLGTAFQANAQQAPAPAPATNQKPWNKTCIEDRESLTGAARAAFEVRHFVHNSMNALREAAGAEKFLKKCHGDDISKANNG